MIVTQVDDSIRERHGMRCVEHGDRSSSEVTVWETEQGIVLNGNHRNRELTPWQARYLAAKLYRLARRIRNRTDPAT